MENNNDGDQHSALKLTDKTLPDDEEASLNIMLYGQSYGNIDRFITYFNEHISGIQVNVERTVMTILLANALK